MNKFGKLISKWVLHTLVLRPVLYIDSWLHGVNPHTHNINVDIAYTPKK